MHLSQLPGLPYAERLRALRDLPHLGGHPKSWSVSKTVLGWSWMRKPPTLQGAITTWDVLAHPWLIVHEFGPRCYLRCLRAMVTGRSTTFLEVVLRK